MYYYICPEIGYGEPGSGVILFKNLFIPTKKIPTHTKPTKKNTLSCDVISS